MFNSELIIKIKEHTQELFSSLGYELVDLNYYRSPEGMILRFLVDRDKGGITLQECAQLNSSIGKLLDELGIINEKYILEVSSPGLDRPLVTEGDFRRAINSQIQIFLKEPIFGKLEYIGRVVSVDVQGICIDLDNFGQIKIQISKINKAKRVI